MTIGKEAEEGRKQGGLEIVQEWILQEGERGKMRLLMESAPRENEKRTLSAHLECVLVLKSLREANIKPFCGTSH